MNDTGAAGSVPAMRVGLAQRPLVLAACSAARGWRRTGLPRMALRLGWPRGAGGRRIRWAPLALRWARMTLSSHALTAVRPTVALSVLHRHFYEAAPSSATRGAPDVRTPAWPAAHPARSGASRIAPAPAAPPAAYARQWSRTGSSDIARVQAVPAWRRPTAPGGSGAAAPTGRTTPLDALAAGPHALAASGSHLAPVQLAWRREHDGARRDRGAWPPRAPSLPHPPQPLAGGPNPPTRRPPAATIAGAGQGVMRSAPGRSLRASGLTLLWRVAGTLDVVGNGRAGSDRSERAGSLPALPGARALAQPWLRDVSAASVWPGRARPGQARTAPAERHASAAAWRAARTNLTNHAGRPAAADALPEPLATRRPAELVWPAPPGRAPAAGGNGGGDAFAAPGPAASSPPAAAPGRPVGGSERHGEAVRATALDPLLASRLADEVMRRIDQRARIARERRGS